MVLKIRPDSAFRQSAVILAHVCAGRVYYGTSRYDF